MKLQHPDLLANDLEAGLGEIHPFMQSVEASLRLRMEGACGINSIAVAERLTQLGYEVDLVISEPRIDVAPDMQHVLAIVHGTQTETTIDTSYSQFLQYAGLSSGYVAFGGKDYFPEQKIVTFETGDSSGLVHTMAQRALYFMNVREDITELQHHTPEFASLNLEEISAVYASIWDPAYYDVFQPTKGTIEAGKRLARYIVPEHVRLIA